MMVWPAVSVLTPTFNRGHVLHRAYDSLARQTMRDFEWVVVDDGSTDETPTLLARWQAEAEFPITWYRYANNRGRNAAVNLGKKFLSGDYTLILDSDDVLLDNTMEIIAYWREKTQIDQLDAVYQLVFRRLDESGIIIGSLPNTKGSELPETLICISAKDMRYKFHATFDFRGVSKTKILCQFNYTELTDSEHCPESNTYTNIANAFQSIFIDHPIDQYITNDYGPKLTDRDKTHIKWPRGNYLLALSIINNDLEYLHYDSKVFFNAARKITRLGLHIGRSPKRQFHDLAHTRARFLWVLAMPGGLVGYIRDRIRGRRASPANADISAWGPAAPPESPQFHPAPERLCQPAPANALGPGASL